MCTVIRLLMQQLCQPERVKSPTFLVLKPSWRETWLKMASQRHPGNLWQSQRSDLAHFVENRSSYIIIQRSMTGNASLELVRHKYSVRRDSMEKVTHYIIWTWIDEVHNHRLIKMETKKLMQPPAEHSCLFCSNPYSFPKTIKYCY